MAWPTLCKSFMTEPFRGLEYQGSLDIHSDRRPAIPCQNECTPIVGWDFFPILTAR